MTLLGFGFVSRGSVIRNCVAFAVWQGVVMTAFARDPDLVLDLWPNGPRKEKQVRVRNRILPSPQTISLPAVAS